MLNSQITLALLVTLIWSNIAHAASDSCQQEINHVTAKCDSTSATRSCLAKRVSPKCAEMIGKTDRADATCKDELQGATQPCAQESVEKGKQCLQKNLSQQCWEELKTTLQNFDDTTKSCQAAIQRVRELCGNKQGKELDQECAKRYQTETKAICNK